MRWSFIPLLVLVLLFCHCGPGTTPPGGGGLDDGGVVSGDQKPSSSDGRSNTNIHCAWFQGTFLFESTNCEAGFKCVSQVSGCQFSADCNGTKISGSIENGFSARLIVNEEGATAEFTYRFSGEQILVESKGPQGNVCNYIGKKDPSADFGALCDCSSSRGDAVCTNTKCPRGFCTWSDTDGGYCTSRCKPGDCPKGYKCEQRLSEKVCVMERDVKKCRSCKHSAQCESIKVRPGVYISAACHKGRCRMRCQSSSKSCTCVRSTPTSGDSTGYCKEC